ncbi:PTS ascorbate transporter subunit IIC [Clostridium botulinum]|uniref:Ascorbate-specific PTS system EIIC component n=2 Tax=Clostridium botulinum TaxID=1491 RepID=A0A0C2SFR2_CLOBO|nr:MULTISPECIES: PTS ascorbate transporter subunit IIC [Clostridium]ACD52606.1 ascorbate-specific PTS system enzyme IIC [Clostridium botulinum E3 str. Alaska E43]AJF30824.1 PTS system ascorbate-specific transporter subunit IIC [Clostridium botulinum]AJF33887.1 PTS system ascorbate-specific transporter subunit IIC [Clostridium botulinum]KAI3348931.1 PTS ascorbate transporter subunit IIC [Clostridium botulinum]KIL08061.1 PTS system ascorbate-specific transporter subunit IIC [Clostridium botulinu
MDFLLSIWEFFQINILTNPAFFIGFIVLIGYLLLRRPLYEAIAGFIKAVVGYLILNVAAGGLVNNFRPILAGLKDRFNLTAAVIDPYFGQTAAQSAVESVGRSFSLMMIVLLIAFLFNIVLVLFRKQTKIRTVFITGHIMVQQSATALWIVLFCFPDIIDTQAVIMLGLLLGTYWAVSSNLTVEATQELTEGGGFAVGHQQMFGIWLTDKLAGKIGNKEKSIEHLKLPGFLSIFNDNVVATGVLMLFFFGTIMGILGPDLLHQIDKGFAADKNFIFYIMEKSLNFAVYLSILQLGVKMFVSELTESFQGISSKLLPGSVPAVDCAATYGFGHANAVTIGFLFGALGQFISIIGLIVFKSPVLIITGFVPVFFDNATFAVYANKKGGLKAAMIIPFISGIIQVLGGAFAAYYFGLAQFGGWHGNFDFATVWPVIGVLMNNLHYVGFGIALVALLAIPQLQYIKNKKGYFKIAEDYEEYLNDLEAN